MEGTSGRVRLGRHAEINKTLKVSCEIEGDSSASANRLKTHVIKKGFEIAKSKVIPNILTGGQKLAIRLLHAADFVLTDYKH